MKFIDGAVYFQKEEILCMADLHFGYEDELRRKGVYVPSSEFEILFSRIKRLVHKTQPKFVVLNGDIKHSFGRISDQEWRHVKRVMDYLCEQSKVIVVTGNHDVVLAPLLSSHELSLVPFIHVAGIGFYHGDELPQTLKDVHTVVIGHEHPAVSITDGVRQEIVKCYLIGEFEGKKLVVLPSMFSLTTGSDLTTHNPQSPFISQRNYEVYILVEDEALFSGTLSELTERMKRL